MVALPRMMLCHKGLNMAMCYRSMQAVLVHASSPLLRLKQVKNALYKSCSSTVHILGYKSCSSTAQNINRPFVISMKSVNKTTI
jgi:hypothetical protein